MHHHHNHHQHSRQYGQAFAIGIVLNIVYVVVEAVFGLMIGSLSLLADAGHNLSDVLGLVLAWGAYSLTKVKPSTNYTYGLRSSTIFASLLNSMILLVAVGGICWEAIRRFSQPVELDSTMMIWVAGIGVIINTATALLFFKGHAHDLNIKGAFLHMAADAGISLGVVLAAIGIMFTGLTWIDPVVSLAIAFVILLGTWGLLRESLHLAVQGVPKNVDPQQVIKFLEALPGVEQVHDLHIWALSTTETALTVHLVKPEPTNEDAMLAEVVQRLHDEFGIEHATLQIERNSAAAQCRQVSPESL